MKALPLFLAALLAGCASVSSNGGFSSVEQAVAERTGAQTKWVRSEDDANSVHTRVKELLAKPLSAADAVQIALLNNPGLQAGYAEAAAPSRAAAKALRVALETRKAWFAAVAAQQNAGYMEQVKDAAEASAELARRMAALGNLSKLAHAREQAFYAEATAQLARSRHGVLAAREHLARQLGLWGDDLGFQLPDRLPELPQSVREAGDLEAQALSRRLDVQAVNGAAETAIRARSEVREAYGAYRTAFDLARHYRDEVVPLRKRISEKMLLRYNGMLASVFDLLADSREQVAAVNAYIESLRAFWLAESDLQMALVGGGQLR